MIKGVGVDNVDISRLNKIYDKWGESLLIKFSILKRYLYTKTEKLPNSLAGKFAAKVTIAKALGNGFRDGLTFKSIDYKISLWETSWYN